MLGTSACSTITGWFEEDDPRIEIIDDLPGRLPVEEVWHRDIGSDGEKNTRLHPLVVGGIVYAAGDTGEVYAYRLADGRRFWKRDINMPVSFAFGGDGKVLVLGGVDGRVVALDARGNERWRVQMRAAVTAISGRYKDTLVVRTADDKIIALKALTGRRLWSKRVSSPQLTVLGVSIPLFYDNMVVVGLDDGHVALIDLADGKTINRIRVGASSGLGGDAGNIVDIDGNIAISRGLLLAAAYQGPLMALDLDTRKVRWLEQLGSNSGPIVAQNRLYIKESNGGVTALKRASGDVLWRNTLLEVKKTIYPAVTRRYVVTGDDEGYVYWLSRSNGKILSRRRFTWTSTEVLSVQAVAGERVLVQTADGDLILTQAAHLRDKARGGI